MQPTDATAIDLSYVEKTFRGGVRALDGISMQVGRGEVFGLLGPNGAGKSTLVKILMTVVRPGRCEGTLLGAPIGHKPALGRVGYLPEHHRFPEYLKGEDVLDFYGALANVPRRERRRRAGELLELVGMSRWSRTRVKAYSKGMRQRIGVAQALMNDPDLVLLDEPTDGVDPVGRRDIRNVLLEMKRRGKTVLLNSHLLSELEMMCDRVAILVRGSVVGQGTIEHLTKDQERYEIALDTAADEAVLEIVRAAMRDADVLAESVELLNGMLVIGDGNPVRVQPVIDALRSGNRVIRSVRLVRPSLEDLFMRAVMDPETGRALDPGAHRTRSRHREGPSA